MRMLSGQAGYLCISRAVSRHSLLSLALRICVHIRLRCHASSTPDMQKLQLPFVRLAREQETINRFFQSFEGRCVAVGWVEEKGFREK